MGKYFEIIYWGCAAILLTLILSSLMDSFRSAFFLSVMLLPGVLFVKFFSGHISFSDRRQGIEHSCYLILTALIIEYYAMILVNWFLYRYDAPELRGMLVNPFFILFMIASLLLSEKYLRQKFVRTGTQQEKSITFISNRRKVTLDLDAVSHIESRDTEVFVRTADGQSYPTRMKISQWNAVLDDRFVRIHRSFIVNRRHIKSYDTRSVHLESISIEISRKYKDALRESSR